MQKSLQELSGFNFIFSPLRIASFVGQEEFQPASSIGDILHNHLVLFNTRHKHPQSPTLVHAHIIYVTASWFEGLDF